MEFFHHAVPARVDCTRLSSRFHCWLKLVRGTTRLSEVDGETSAQQIVSGSVFPLAPCCFHLVCAFVLCGKNAPSRQFRRDVSTHVNEVLNRNGNAPDVELCGRKRRIDPVLSHCPRLKSKTCVCVGGFNSTGSESEVRGRRGQPVTSQLLKWTLLNSLTLETMKSTAQPPSTPPPSEFELSAIRVQHQAGKFTDGSFLLCLQ